jgi:hypothetical protein
VDGITKVKFYYGTEIRFVAVYVSEACAVNKSKENSLAIWEMKIPGKICGMEDLKQSGVDIYV